MPKNDRQDRGQWDKYVKSGIPVRAFVGVIMRAP